MLLMPVWKPSLLPIELDNNTIILSQLKCLHLWGKREKILVILILASKILHIPTHLNVKWKCCESKLVFSINLIYACKDGFALNGLSGGEERVPDQTEFLKWISCSQLINVILALISKL
jgi:hypothetical protein